MKTMKSRTAFFIKNTPDNVNFFISRPRPLRCQNNVSAPLYGRRAREGETDPPIDSKE